MKLKANEGVQGVAVGGVEYLNDETGFVDVPDEFVQAVLGAGYTLPPVVAEVVEHHEV